MIRQTTENSQMGYPSFGKVESMTGNHSTGNKLQYASSQYTQNQTLNRATKRVNLDYRPQATCNDTQAWPNNSYEAKPFLLLSSEPRLKEDLTRQKSVFAKKEVYLNAYENNKVDSYTSIGLSEIGTERFLQRNVQQLHRQNEKIVPFESLGTHRGFTPNRPNRPSQTNFCSYNDSKSTDISINIKEPIKCQTTRTELNNRGSYSGGSNLRNANTLSNVNSSSLSTNTLRRINSCSISNKPIDFIEDNKLTNLTSLAECNRSYEAQKNSNKSSLANSNKNIRFIDSSKPSLIRKSISSTTINLQPQQIDGSRGSKLTSHNHLRRDDLCLTAEPPYKVVEEHQNKEPNMAEPKTFPSAKFIGTIGTLATMGIHNCKQLQNKDLDAYLQSLQTREKTERFDRFNPHMRPKKSALKKNKSDILKKVTIMEENNKHYEVSKWLNDVDQLDRDEDEAIIPKSYKNSVKRVVPGTNDSKTITQRDVYYSNIPPETNEPYHIKGEPTTLRSVKSESLIPKRSSTDIFPGARSYL